MKKFCLIYILFFIGSIYGLIAQTSSWDFYVNQQQSSYLGNYSTWNKFEKAINTLVEQLRQNMKIKGVGFRWVQEPTRIEKKQQCQTLKL